MSHAGPATQRLDPHDPDARRARQQQPRPRTGWTPGWPPSRPPSPPATSTARPGCSRPPASGATWSRSPGTSRPSRTPTASPTCSAATLDQTDPTGFRTAEPPDEADGVTTAWIEFETAVGRGRGLLRLDADDKAWTLLTTLYELKGHEEPKGTARPKGAEHGANRDRETWAEQREREAAELGYKTQPYVLVVGGGQGGIALGARLRQLGVPDDHRRQAGRVPATSGAAGTSRCACTTRSGTTTCPTSSSPRTGRCSPPRTRSPTGSSPTPR